MIVIPVRCYISTQIFPSFKPVSEMLGAVEVEEAIFSGGLRQSSGFETRTHRPVTKAKAKAEP
jgi:hypothetical protein